MVLGVLHRVLHRVLGVLNKVLGVLHRVLGVLQLHRVLGVPLEEEIDVHLPHGLG